VKATIVAQSNIEFIWPSAERFISDAFNKHTGDETEEDTKKLLEAGEAQLWIAHDGRGVRAAAVTRLATVPSGRRVCFCMACGGNGISEWLEVGMREIEKFAKANKCDLVRLSGRRGWREAFKPLGYKEPFVILEKALNSNA
jgi:hypothetical protein